MLHGQREGIRNELLQEFCYIFRLPGKVLNFRRAPSRSVPTKQILSEHL